MRRGELFFEINLTPIKLVSLNRSLELYGQVRLKEPTFKPVQAQRPDRRKVNQSNTCTGNSKRSQGGKLEDPPQGCRRDPDDDGRRDPREHRSGEGVGTDPEHPRRVPGGEDSVFQGEDDRPRGRDSIVAKTGQEREGDREAEVPESHKECHQSGNPHPVVGDVDREERQHRDVDREVHRQEDHQRPEESEFLPHPDREEERGKPADETDRERHGKSHQFDGALRDPDQGLGLFSGITGEDRRRQYPGEHPGNRPQEDDPLQGNRVLPG